MYRQLKTWADTIEPLERTEELKIISETTSEKDLIELMLRHNARMIVEEIHKWHNTYELDEAASIVISKLIRTFSKWDRKCSFYYFARLRIKSALHEGIRKYSKSTFEDIEEYSEIIPDYNVKEYNDIFEVCAEILEDDEYEIIENIYRNGQLVKDSSDISSISRKHGQILAKIREFLKDFE